MFLMTESILNTLRPKQNNIFKSIFLKTKVFYFDSHFTDMCSLNLTDNKAAFIQVMAQNQITGITDHMLCIVI